MLRENGRRLDNTFLRLRSLYIVFFFVQHCVVCVRLVLLCTFVWMVRVRGVVAGLLLGVMGVVGWEWCRLLGGIGGWLGGGYGVVETKACGANLGEGSFADVHQN